MTEHDDLPEAIAAELQTASSTATPWWWGIKTLVKVSQDTGIFQQLVFRS